MNTLQTRTCGYMDSVMVVTTDHTPEHEARRAHYQRYGVAPGPQVERYSGRVIRVFREMREAAIRATMRI